MKPDIIVINPDQMRADALHHLGCKAAHTPNMDKLSEEGVSFKNAFCQNPVCVPSRCSFTTGLYPHTRGHRTMSYLLRPEENNIFKLLKDNGYYVWSSGRGDCISGQDKKWQKECFDKVYYKCGSDKGKDDGRGEPGSIRYKSFLRGTVKTNNVDGISHDNDYQWTVGCTELIKNANKNKPIFAFLGLMNPHPPYKAEKKYLDLIDESLISPPIKPSNSDEPLMQKSLRDALGLEDWDEKNILEIRKTYLAMCARVDEMVGMVIDALKESGRYDNSLIVIMSDHGDFTGDYTIVEKAQNLFADCLTNVPFIVKMPKGYKVDNGVNDTLVELVDFYATVKDVSGSKTDEWNFGKSLVPAIADKSVNHRDYVFCEGGRLAGERHCTEEVENYFNVKVDEYEPRISIQQREDGSHGKGIMIRNKEYKYVYRLYEKDEFYVLKDGENKNQIDCPEHSQIIEQMRNEMLKWLVTTSDVVPVKGDARFSDDFYLETVNALAHFRVSPAIKFVMKLTNKDFTSLINGIINKLHIDTNKAYRKN